MKITAIALIGSITPFLTPMMAQAGTISSNSNYSALYSLGDSIPDDGNLYNLLGQTFPPEPFYYQGRFTNGPTFAELLAEKLGLENDPDKNVAFGGSGTGDFHANPALNPGLNGGTIAVGLRAQVTSVIADQDGEVDPNALYLIASGANDYIYQDPANPSVVPTSAANVNTIVGNIGEAIDRLYDAGARNFFVLGITNYTNLPLASSGDLDTNLALYEHLQDPTALSADDLTDAHNSQLEAFLDDFSERPDAQATYFDFDQFINGIIADADSLGFTNTTVACFNSDIAAPDFTQPICSNPDEYVFYDKVHPSAKTHQLLAEAIAPQVPEPVPEPLTILGAGVAMGFGSLFKRKLAKTGKKS